MFEQTFVQTQAQTRKPWTVAVSLSLQCSVVAVVLLIPLLHPETLRIPEAPRFKPIRTWVDLPLTPRPVNTSTQAPALRSPSPVREFAYIPTSHPAPNRLTSVAPVGDYAPMEWADATGFALPAALTGVLPSAVPPKPAPSPTNAPAAGPRRIGGEVAEAKLRFAPRPVYPKIAVTARAEGTVKLEAVIAADGSIKNLRVLSGSPLLAGAAIDAVRQWRYQPTLLNGVAVEVLTEISVNFNLTR